MIIDNRKYSFILLNSFFILGIITSNLFFNIGFLVNILCFVSIGVIVSYCFNRYSLCSLFLYLCCFVIGIFFCKQQHFNCMYSNALCGIEKYVCIAKNSIDIDRKVNSVECVVVKIKKNGVWIDVEDVLNINLVICNKKNDFCGKIFYGDTFLVSGAPSRIIKDNRSVRSVGIYNYYSSRGVYFNHFVDVLKLNKIGSNKISVIHGFFDSFRESLKSVVLKNIRDFNVKKVLSKLLFGKNYVIERELNEAYVFSGVVHVLSISGMHIGLIFVIFSFFLSLVVKNRVKDILSLLFIWFYGFLVGLPASVLRANLMITFYRLNIMFERNLSAYSTIASSLILSLIINPDSLYSVGFQLSFLSTFGIICLASDVNRFLKRFFYNYFGSFDSCIYVCIILLNDRLSGVRFYHFYLSVLNYFSSYFLMSVSLFFSVNVFILPILVYNFGYFNFFSIIPNLFIANLVFIIIFFGILLVFVSFIPFVSYYLSRIVELNVCFMNFIVSYFSTFKDFTFRIVMFGVDFIVWYYIIILFLVFIFKRRVCRYNLLY